MRLSKYAWILGILNVVDGVLTSIGVERGWCSELNPMMNWLMEVGGQFLFLLIKIGVTFIFIGFLEWWYRKSHNAFYYKTAIGAYIFIYFFFSFISVGVGLWLT